MPKPIKGTRVAARFAPVEYAGHPIHFSDPTENPDGSWTAYIALPLGFGGLRKVFPTREQAETEIRAAQHKLRFIGREHGVYVERIGEA